MGGLKSGFRGAPPSRSHASIDVTAIPRNGSLSPVLKVSADTSVDPWSVCNPPPWMKKVHHLPFLLSLSLEHLCLHHASVSAQVVGGHDPSKSPAKPSVQVTFQSEELQ